MTLASPAGVTIRLARADEYAAAASAYAAWGYHGGLLPSDVVFIAERGGIIVGVVRRTIEFGVTMLRGMHIDPAVHRQRIGAALLDAFVHDLGPVACTCVPYRHLEAFYGAAGFVKADEDTAPNFLRDRLSLYRSQNRDMILMTRIP